MSDNDLNLDEFLSDEEQVNQAQGSKLRALLETANARNKELAKKLEAVEAAQAANAVTEKWNTLGVPESLRKGYRGDLTPEGVETWWNDIKDFVNVEAAQQAPAQEAQEQVAQREALVATQKAASIGGDAGMQGFEAAVNTGRTLRQQVADGTASKADVKAFWESAGIPIS